MKRALIMCLPDNVDLFSDKWLYTYFVKSKWIVMNVYFILCVDS